MKKAIYLIVLSLITIGCIIFGTMYHTGKAVVRFAHWLDDEIVEADSVTETGEGAVDAFTSIHLEADIASVEIRQSKENKIEWSVRNSGVPTYKVEDGVLTIRQKHPHKNLTGNHSCDIILTVSEDTDLVKLQMDADVGGIQVYGISAEKTSVSADVGEVSFELCELGDTVIEADVGNIHLKGCGFEDLQADADVGNINVEATHDMSDYTFKLESDVGDICVNGQNMRKRYDVNGKGKFQMDADCDVGEMNITYQKESDTL